MDEELRRATARAMGHESWDEVVVLGGGRGGAYLATKDGVARVVKVHRPDDPYRGRRERAALVALGGAAGTPSLLAESDDPAFVVMSVVEGEGSVADALLGSDAGVAHGAVVRWAQALGAVHAAGSPEVRTSFADALAERGPDLPARSLADDFAAAAEMYAAALDDLGLPPHTRALDELRALPAALADDDHEVLSPADTCPDNNVVGADRVRLIDFEHAELRHRAWDVAYLLAPWPSCWCAWTLPHEVAEAGIAAYCAAVGEAVRPQQLTRDLEVATLGWQAMTPAWFLAGALEDDDAGAGPRRPARRAFVLHRLDAVASSTSNPHLAALGGDLAATLRGRWGDVRLEAAPAFRREP
ncbi:phosphotransferase family protein [Nocardioides sp. T5]|uniref:phosphotransferase family protein n=1 Tax=Nocardioides sp. T5 TaxID=3400182 RepID=UPI003A84C603